MDIATVVFTIIGGVGIAVGLAIFNLAGLL
jgi:hypothetical protein